MVKAASGTYRDTRHRFRRMIAIIPCGESGLDEDACRDGLHLRLIQ
jgi:hypothetical protein